MDIRTWDWEPGTRRGTPALGPWPPNPHVTLSLDGGQKTVCVARYIRQCLGPIDSILRRSAAGVASCKEVLGLMRARRATEEAYGQALLKHCLIGATPDADRTRHSCV